MVQNQLDDVGTLRRMYGQLGVDRYIGLDLRTFHAAAPPAKHTAHSAISSSIRLR